MVYRAIGLMSGSSLDGLDIVFAAFHESAGKWAYEIVQADCYPYSEEWIDKLKSATSLPALDYQLLHVDYGHYLGREVNRFIETHQLQYKIALIGSHGHTTFHVPARKMTAQLGDGASIAAETQLPVVSDLRSMDLAVGGQGAPIVPIGEKLLLDGYEFFLNLGGIANVSRSGDPYIAFDICAANRVLNMLAQEAGQEYDDGGGMAARGTINISLLEKLNALEYYRMPAPKSLANDFGTDVVYPMVRGAGSSIDDTLRTYVEHIVVQIKASVAGMDLPSASPVGRRLLITGGGAFNTFMVERLKTELSSLNIETVVAGPQLASYKEALIMALIGVLRWREENNVLSSVTGASRDTVGGAMWIAERDGGQES